MTLLAAASNGIEVTETLIVALMLVSALVAIAVDRLRLPYTVALVLVGLGLGVSGAFTDVRLTSDLILLVFLPPLLFEGAINMDLAELKRRWFQVGVLAVVGTTVSAAVIAAALVVVPGIELPLAVVLAVMLAATDPISVLAVFKEHGVGTGLRTLMEGESIFNDALAIVFYLIAVDIAFGDEAVTVQAAVTEFGAEVLIGVAAGAGVGLLAHRLMASLDDHLVEISLSLVTAYGAYLLADRLGGSGVIAVVAAGLLIGNYGTESAMSASSRVSLTEFWEVLAFLANSALFLVIGLEFHIEDLRGRTLVATLVAIVAMLVGRAVIAFGLLRPFRRSSPVPVPLSWQTAVFWGGLRGSIPIALVLGLEVRRFGGVDAVAVVFGVVFFSLVVQGLTYKPLLDRLGLTTQTDDESRHERIYAHTIALRAARRELAAMHRGGEVTESFYVTSDRRIGDDLDRYEQQLAELDQTETSVRQRQVGTARRRLAAAQRLALSEAARAGRITDAMARDVAVEIERGTAGETPPDVPPPTGSGPPVG